MSEDYSFMRTGESSPINQLNNDEIINAAAIVTIFMEDAMKIAEMFTKHCGQRVISKEITIRSLKIRATMGENFWQQPNIKERLEDAKNFIKNTDESTEEDDHLNVTNETVTWTEPVCQCTLCNIFKNIPIKWNSWQPCNQYDFIIRDAIDKTS